MRTIDFMVGADRWGGKSPISRLYRQSGRQKRSSKFYSDCTTLQL